MPIFHLRWKGPNFHEWMHNLWYSRSCSWIWAINLSNNSTSGNHCNPWFSVIHRKLASLCKVFKFLFCLARKGWSSTKLPSYKWKSNISWNWCPQITGIEMFNAEYQGLMSSISMSDFKAIWDDEMPCCQLKTEIKTFIVLLL